MATGVFVQVTSLKRPADSNFLAYGILLHSPEDGGTKVLHNFGNYGSFYTRSHLRKIVIINIAVVNPSNRRSFYYFFISE